MSILSKSHVGAEVNFDRIKQIVMSKSGWTCEYGSIIRPEVGLDNRGYYVDLYLEADDSSFLSVYKPLRTSFTLYLYFARRNVSYLDFDHDRRHYNEYQKVYGNGDICPFFRYRNIYGPVCLDGCQQLKNMDFIDHIHGDVLLDDMPHEVIFPDNLIIDGNIKVLTHNGCWVREQNWTHISAKNKKKMLFL